MASLIRCDICKKLSDDPTVGHIGKEWSVMEYKNRLAKITTQQDLCKSCVIRVINDSPLRKLDEEDDSHY